MSNLTGRSVVPKGQKRKRKKENDDAFRKWLRTQPCCSCNHPPPNDAAHVRLGGRGGMAMKPLWSSVPLCFTCHRVIQHTKSHLELFTTDEWLRLADEYLNKWRKTGIKS